MNGSIGSGRHAVAAALAACLALGLVGCGDDDGAGSQGLPGSTQTGPSPGAGGAASAVAVTVTGAIPTTGNAVVTGTSVAGTAVAGTQRQVVADGAGGGLQHRFSVVFDGVSGTVLRVDHGWGASTSALDAATACAATLVAGGPPACGGAVTIDVATRQIRFANALLRGQGTFTSILNGGITYPAP